MPVKQYLTDGSCHQQVFPMHKILTALIAIVFFSATLTYGDHKTPVEPLKTYKAIYESKIKGIDIIFKRQLSREDDGTLLLTVEGEKFIFRMYETSRFEQKGKNLIPINYKYKFSGGLNRRKEVQFLTKTATINSLDRGKWYTLPSEKNVLDRLCVQEQLRLLLIDQTHIPKQIDFRVADGPRIKDYKLIYLGEEILDTNIGGTKTIRFARKFEKPGRLDEIWLAPDLDFLMVKHIHKEDGKLNQAVLLKITMQGFEIKEKISPASKLLEE